MAVVFKFMWSSTTVNLVSGINSVDYIPAAGDPRGGFVTDTFIIQVDGSSHDNLATFVQSIDLMRVYAMRYRNDRTWEDPVWLHAKMDSESTERRAFVRNIDMNWNTDPFTVTGHAGSTLRVERGPWERTVRRSALLMSERAGASLTFDYTDTPSPYDPAGDIPGRLPQIWVRSDASGAPLARLWMGFRSEIKHPSVSNFIDTWEFENGANNGSESGVTDDGGTDVNGASPGGGSGVFVKLVETDLDWDKETNGGIFQEVCEIELQDVSANEQDNFGDFLWLLRAMLPSNATTWEVQLRWGYSGMTDADRRRGPIVEISGTAWDYFEMGRESIPLRNIHALPLSEIGDGAEATYAIQVWARRTSGAADLYLDCLCPIPLDEGWAKVSGFVIASDADGYCYIGEGLDGSTTAVVFGPGSTMTHDAVLSSNEFRVPVGDGRLITVYAGSASHSMATGISSRLQYYERWLNLRGGE